MAYLSRDESPRPRQERVSARLRRVVVAGLSLVMTTSCVLPMDRTHDDVDRARTAWEGFSPARYSFELATWSHWAAATLSVQVEDGAIISSGSDDPAIARLAMTLDGVWDRLLNAKASDCLKSASFDRRGIPLEVDIDCAGMVDEETRLEVRNFRVDVD